VLFGLGGWTLAVLIALTVWPSVPLDSELLAVVSVGLPIWFGVYAGWVAPGTPSGLRVRAIRNAGIGALLGAWLGFTATSGIAAVLTTIVGAAVAANLGLLLLDVRSPRASDRVAAPSRREVDRESAQVLAARVPS
jgi:hypothetical protein